VTEDVFVQLSNVCKVYDQEDAVVNNLNLEIKKGEFLTILGPSGCGKTTTLRMIAGFETPTNGNIIIDGENITDKSPHQRPVNTAFQNYALFPHMNIFDNIAFGLKMKKVLKDEITKRVLEMLKVVRLEGYENRMPSQLSGGQMQRVAIARALINNPKGSTIGRATRRS
jgi:ABC-type spermidine/putrescine transport systems, ATPase components